MKNRYIIILLSLLFNLNFFHSASSEEFNFDVTELQVTENGNILRGIKGGKVTTRNNEIIITADTFEYNKLTMLLEAEGNVKLRDKIANVLIESNKIFYSKNKEEIYTKGKSKAVNGPNIIINAEEYFKYNKLTSLLEAKGNVKLDDTSKEITIYTDEIIYLKNEEKIYTLGKTKINIEDKYSIEGSDLTLLRNQMLLSSDKKATIKDNELNIYKINKFQYSINQEILKGEKIEITTNFNQEKSDKYFFKEGFFNLKDNKFLAKDVSVKFHKTLFGDDQNDPRINAVSGYGNKFIKNFEKGVFTSCKKNDKCPPWKITSEKIQHNTTKKQITYKNAWLELYDFPVFYFPKFFHPDPTVKRQSGFLKPQIGSSNTLGDSMYIPYFHVISENADITVKPRLFSDNTVVWQNEFRKKTKRSLTVADFSITKGHDSTSDDQEDSRTHFFTNTKVNLGLKEYINSNLEINYEKTSNDNYLKLFELEGPLLLKDNSSLESFVSLDLEHQYYDLELAFEMYETLSGASSNRYQYVLPTYNLSKNFILDEIIGSFSIDSTGSNTIKDTNVTSSIISNDFIYDTEDIFSNKGIKSNFEILLKNINSIGKNNIKYKNSPQSELMSAYIYSASLPMQKYTNTDINTFTPKLSLRFSPHEMKNNINTDRRIDTKNVFVSDRLGLGDSFEAGESVTIGIDFTKEKMNNKDGINEIEKYFDLKLSTVLRLSEEKNIPTSSTLNKKTSNIFGQLDYKFNEIISLNYNFSLTNDFNVFEYNSILAKFDFNKFSTQFDYLEERGVVGRNHVIENTTEYKFNEENSISFNTRRNQKINLTEYYDLVYEYKTDCLIAGIKYKKNYYNDADIKPEEELYFSITIIPFYTFSPDKIVLNKNRID
tara:strand:+ start:33 stop:2681 length:2649 start_codon:yes stop_codon:yes gene_type:complete